MKTETSLAIIAVVGLIMKYIGVPGNGLVITISLLILALIYFPGAFYFFSDKSIKNQNLALSIISGFMLAVIPIGILFKVQYWPGSGINLLFGSVSALVILIIVFILNSKSREGLKTYYRNMILRASVLFVLATTAYLIPTKSLMAVQYRNDSEMLRLKEQLHEDPENLEYRQEYENYIMKTDSIRMEERKKENY